MTVALLVKHANSETELVPVSTQDFFKHSWVPLAKRLGLVWIPLFETGIPLNHDDIPPVLAELTRLRTAVSAETSELAAPGSSYMLTRIDVLLAGLEKAARDTSVALIFVG